MRDEAKVRIICAQLGMLPSPILNNTTWSSIDGSTTHFIYR